MRTTCILAIFLLLAACGDDGDNGAANNGQNNGQNNGVACDEIPPSSRVLDPNGEALVDFPDPTGPYGVGVHRLHLRDTSRTAPDDPEAPREVVVHLFYPSDVTDAAPSGIATPTVASAVSSLGFPPAWAVRIEANATYDLPISTAQDQWPVVLYSHGLTSYHFDNQPMLEDLASRGYVVAAITHPGGAGIVELEDGSTVRLTPIPEANDYEEALELYAALDGRQDENWTPDLSFVVDSLSEMSGSDCHWLSGRLDTSRVGAFGYSFGGAASYQFCRRDERCVGAADIDGSFFGTRGETDKPIMYLTTRGQVDQTWVDVRDQLSGDAYRVIVDDTTHSNFAIWGLLIEGLLNLQGSAAGLGRINPEDMAEIQLSYVRAFLNRYLLEEDEDTLLEDASPYDGVLFEGRVSDMAVGERVAVGTTLVGSPRPSTVRGIEVGLLNTDTAVTADQFGRWKLPGIPDAEPYALTLDHEEAVPHLIAASAGGHSQHMLPQSLIRQSEFDVLTDAAGVEMDPDAGHLLVVYIHTIRSAPITGVEGATLSAIPGDGPHYITEDFDGLVEEATGTTASGGVLFLNVEPGNVPIAANFEREPCALAGLDSDSVPVVAGRLSLVLALCSE